MRYSVSVVGDSTRFWNKEVSLTIVSHLAVSIVLGRFSLCLIQEDAFSKYSHRPLFSGQPLDPTAMARQTPFTVYDLSRKKTRKLGTPPSKISESRLSDEWRVARSTRSQAAAGPKKVPSRKKKKTLTGTKAKSTKVPKSAAELLRSDDGEDTCMQCKFSSNIFVAPGTSNFASRSCDATRHFVQPRD